MGAIGQLLFWILSAVLPWLFSGETKAKVTNHAGLEDMDNLSGTKDLTAAALPVLMALCCLLLSGCARETHHYHLVEPGAVVEAVEGKVKVRSPGTDAVGDYDPVGKVIMPKSVYRQLREEWIKAHPEATEPVKP